MVWTRERRSIVAVGMMALVVWPCVARAAPESEGAPAPLRGIPNGPPLTPGENSEETYQLNFVGIQHFEWGGYATQRGYVAKGERWEAFRGKHKLKLGPVEFYEAVARPDRSAEARRHVIITGSVLAAGVGLFLGGAIYGISQLDSDQPPKAAIYFIAGGALMVFIASKLKFETATEPEAYRLARDYNDKLRAHLGLPPIVEDPTQPRASTAPPPARRIGFMPALAPNGGGLAVVGSF